MFIIPSFELSYLRFRAVYPNANNVTIYETPDHVSPRLMFSNNNLFTCRFSDSSQCFFVRTFQGTLPARALLIQLQHHVGNLDVLLVHVFAGDFENDVLLVLWDLLLGDVLHQL